MKQIKNGLILSIVIAALSILLARFLPIGSVAIAIMLGIVIGNIVTVPKSFESGITYSEKTLLAFAIALMGIDLNFAILSSLGLKTVILIILAMVLTVFAAVVIGRIFKVDKKLSLLLGIGNGVCGSSAIAAAAPIIKPNQNHIGLSVAVVNLLGTVGIFLLPAIGFFLEFSDIDTGILIGNTLQAVGQVTAAGFSVSDTGGISATTVKMGRVLLLTPLIFILIYIYHKEKDPNVKTARFPAFILFFILFSILGSTSLLDENIKSFISTLSHLSLVVAMSAVGLKIQFSHIKNEGTAAFKTAGAVFLVQIIFSAAFLYAI